MMAALDVILARPGVSDVVINGAAGMWVDAGSGLVPEPGWEAAEAQVRQLARDLVALGGRHLDDAHPCVDVRAGAGIRVHAVLPPLSAGGTSISIRVAGAARSLDDLARSAMMTAPQREQIDAVMRAGQSLLVTGAAGTGKTTLLAAAVGAAPVTERIITIEDVAELRIAHPHVVSLEVRQPNIEGAGGVGLEQLVREALRMRPDRLVLGECRGAEIALLLSALNTGHGGGGTTLHANSLKDVVSRLESIGLLAGLSPEVLARQAVSAFALVVHLERTSDVQRRVAGVGQLRLSEAGLLECR